MRKLSFHSYGLLMPVAFLLAIIVPNFSLGQDALVCDDSTHLVEYNGTFQDFIIPNDPNLEQIEITAKGGDGGFAELSENCRSNGGEGASLTTTFNIGDSSDAIPYGSTIRFIVGQAGEKGTAASTLGTGFTYGGGGGGTAILYKAPDTEEWIILAVAGGGGGAYQGEIIGFCVDNEAGQGGRAETNGGNGNGDIDPSDGGTDGNGGEGSFEISGGGGGAFSAGQGITCIEIIGTDEVGEGQAGYPEGGAGGASEGCVSFTFRDGGFGFGGGGCGIGAAGGGGGYSGGGGGGSTGRGGGGGSFLHEINIDGAIQAGENVEDTQDGFISYKCIINTPAAAPVASCVEELEINLDENGFASISTDMVDNGSFHPDSLSFTLSLNEAVFTCEDLGVQSITLTVTAEDEQSDQCDAILSISDNVAPQISCPDNITVACDTSAMTSTGLAIATDNCSLNPLVNYSDINTGDCAISCIIERTWTATDASGHTAQCIQIIEQSPIIQINSAFQVDPEQGIEGGPITLGFTHHTLTVTPEGATCVIDWLSDATLGGETTPLPNGNFTIDGTDCSPDFVSLDSDGKLSNPLLAQALLLNIHLRLDPELAERQISSMDCDVHPVLLQALPSNATFEDLQIITNYALANLIFTPFLDLLTGSLECFNSQFSFCNSSEGLLLPPVSKNQDLKIQYSVNPQEVISTLNLFPNPAENFIYVNPNFGYGQEAVINIHDINGKLVLAMNISELTTNPIRLNLYNFSNGIYEVLLFTKGKPVQSGKMIVQ